MMNEEDSPGTSKIGQSESKTDKVWRAFPFFDMRRTNLVLLVDDWCFDVHKDVLEKSSDYFKAMFSSTMVESSQDVISLNLVPPEPFRILVRGMYTGELYLTVDNVFAVIEVAQMLQIRAPLYTQYIKFLREEMMTSEYCVEVMFLCESVNLPEVYHDFRRYCLAHFLDLRFSLQTLTESELCDYLSDKHLVIEDEIQVVEAVHRWCWREEKYPPAFSDSFKEKVKKIITACVYVKDVEGACDSITDTVLGNEHFAGDNNMKIMDLLDKRPRQEEVFMFWSLLTTTNADGLVDVIKLSLDTGEGEVYDSMTAVVEQPGYDLGTAVCVKGAFVYLSGGGPKFGNVNWIRQVWKFDSSQRQARWQAVTDLKETRRHHAMVTVGRKLYIFGGFGKFRVKNHKLQSYDLILRNWEELPPTSVHVISPATTTHQHNIYFLENSRTVHVFNTVSRMWSLVVSEERLPRQLSSTSAPLAMYSVKDGDRDSLVVIFREEDKYKLTVFYSDEQEGLFDISPTVAVLEGDLKYEGSVLVCDKVVIFLSSLKRDENWDRDADCSQIKKVKMFDPVTKELSDMPDIQNVKKALSIVVLPHLPNSFEMGNLSRFGF